MKIYDPSQNPLASEPAGQKNHASNGPNQAGGPGAQPEIETTSRLPQRAARMSPRPGFDRIHSTAYTRMDLTSSTRRVEPAASNQTDQVQLSNLSRELRLLSEETAERIEQVEQLRAAYRSGTYQPDITEVSRRIIDEALHTSPQAGW
ncbi:MAG: flagellar biosynthesis anti-sigma factor FlgM [Bryobacteraceae bacterium]|nr:flagellar biosynthesis anti-sigma factor FlgM [Bryobacteraceae bacterium]MDW8380235.1 flagellar biosynthesis anti-sigma factor FlgM [Bryobacterales bacterium]